MYRTAIEQLENWQSASNRKPLIIQGARQVGKTWLMKELGKRKYEQTAYINFESSQYLKQLFDTDFDTNRIISAIQIETGIQINPHNTLIVLDEIQEAEGGLTALKYFYENAPEYHIIAAGSLLGVSLHQKTSFPVGKVDFLHLFPLNFTEYLLATGQAALVELLNENKYELIKSFKHKYIEALKQYYCVGGMPEAVLVFSLSGNYNEVRQIQNNILSAYERDFSKHAPQNIVPRIRMIWNAIPAQLAKENKKFIYSAIKQGSRAKDYELALTWLMDCGLVHKVNRVNKPSIPLKAYEDLSGFKLFLVDVGLLTAMSRLDVRTLLRGNAVFEEFKGAITEQYVLQQLKTINDLPIYYWSASNATAEIDFIVQSGDKIFPIEVKAEENLRAKSLKYFQQKYPHTKAVRTSMADFRREDWLHNVPLYAIDYCWRNGEEYTR